MYWNPQQCLPAGGQTLSLLNVMNNPIPIRPTIITPTYQPDFFQIFVPSEAQWPISQQQSFSWTQSEVQKNNGTLPQPNGFIEAQKAQVVMSNPIPSQSEQPSPQANMLLSSPRQSRVASFRMIDSSNALDQIRISINHTTTPHIEEVLSGSCLSERMEDSNSSVLPCKVEPTLNLCNDGMPAESIIQSSVFFEKPELIFSKEFSKPFLLKPSVSQNDGIVFSKIKQYRKNQPATLPSEAENQPTADSIECKGQRKANSKFHNLNKLFMYKLLATFSLWNLEELEVPGYLHCPLLQLIANVKLSTKEMRKYNKKTEFFSHDHYNLLFLHLTEKTIGYLAANPFAVYLHQLCFNVDLTSQGVPLEKIQYINIIKKFCCQIVLNSNMHGNSSNNDHQDSMQSSERQDMRKAYTQRALAGIASLSQGLIVRRF